MQLKNLGTTPPKEFNFIDPFTDEPTDIFLTVHPIKSKYGKETEHKMRLRIVELMQDENNIEEVDGKKNLKHELIMDETIRMISEMVIGWKGIEDDKGKQIKFTPEVCLETMKEHQSIADAVYSFANTVGNFQK